MDPELIFILVLIVFSMLEGMIRKARGQRPGGAEPNLPPGWPTPGGTFPPEELDGGLLGGLGGQACAAE